MSTRKQLPLTIPLGITVQTPGVMDGIGPDAVLMALRRHQTCDWGDVSDGDWERNNEAAKIGGMLHSAYEFRGDRFWIITEAGHTTVLLPDEY